MHDILCHMANLGSERVKACLWCMFACLLGTKLKIMAGIIQKTELCVTDYGINLSLLVQECT